MQFKYKFFLIFLVFSGNTVCDEKVFTVVSEPFPPYVGANLKNKGWAWEITKMALESQGYKTQLEIKPWARAKMEAEQGKYDALFPAYWTKERHQHFIFSMPIVEVKTGFWKQKNRKDIYFDGKISSLKNYQIGVTRDYATSKEFDKADYLNKYYTNDSGLGMKMLYKGRLDLVAGNELPILYRLRTNLELDYTGIISMMEFIEPPLKINYIHLAISKKSSDYLQKVEDFNIGLRKIMLDGTYNDIKKKHGFD